MTSLDKLTSSNPHNTPILSATTIASDESDHTETHDSNCGIFSSNTRMNTTQPLSTAAALLVDDAPTTDDLQSTAMSRRVDGSGQDLIVEMGETTGKTLCERDSNEEQSVNVETGGDWARPIIPPERRATDGARGQHVTIEDVEEEPDINNHGTSGSERFHTSV